MVVSALAVKLPLCKLASVADDETKIELMAALGFSKPSLISAFYPNIREILQIAREADLVLVDKIYIHMKHNIDPLFLRDAQENYGVQIEKAGFDVPMATGSFINRIISTQTYRRIPIFIDPSDIDKNTSMIIVNAAHYKASWQKSFDIRTTKMSKFRYLNNTIAHVPMMRNVQYHQYFSDETLGFSMVTMLLSSYASSMTIIVPHSPNGLPALLSKMEKQPDLLNKATNKATFECVKIQIPKFVIKTSIYLDDLLKEVGIKRIFNTSSGLDAILTKDSPLKNLHLSKVKQKIFIEFDEYGVYFPKNKGGLERIEEFMEIRPMHDKKEKSLIADRPFLFSINIHGGMNGATHAGTDDITDQLFTGVYYGPE